MPDFDAPQTAEEIFEKIKGNPKVAKIIDNLPPVTIKRIKEPSSLYTPYSLIQNVIGAYYCFSESGSAVLTPPPERIEKYYNNLIFLKEDDLALRYSGLAADINALRMDLLRTDVPLEKYLDLFIEFDDKFNEFMAIHAEVLRALKPRIEKHPYQTGIF